MRSTSFESQRRGAVERGGAPSYSGFIQDLPTPALLLDVEGYIVRQVNDRFLKLTGYERGDVVGRDVGGLSIADARKDGVNFKQLVETNPQYRNAALQLSGPTGDIHHVLSSARLISEPADSYLLVLFTELRAQRYLQRVGVEVIARKQRQVGESLQEELTQTLTGLRLLGRALAVELEDDPRGPETMADDFNIYLEKAAMLTRKLREELLPVEVDEEGLAAALMRLACETEERYGLPCRFTQGENVRIADHTAATTCYYLVDQTVAYMIRTGCQGAVEIELDTRSGGVELEVVCRDFVTGENEVTGIRKTLRLMQYTLGLLGGEVKVDGASDGILRVLARIP